ncbi:MAG: manganese-binding transcriptional regulator MntR [Pseudomonadota bacterium]|jgi:DtxR family manganese transport transcriptional regulator|nr:manganese-binding transcriptional regulator MntR [Sphingomonas sp.]MDQ3471862.1 manganese-binding transcriptional regulator MntR [Pseudomonadota bacterium]
MQVEEPPEDTRGASLPAPDQRAENFRQTRRARSTEIAEDYVELIADLIDSSGEARAVDIARGLGVSHATVVKTIGRLQRDGLVVTKPYRAVFLTDEGRRLALWSRRRHELVLRFLLAIGVSEETAHADAEGMEHHVSAETLAAFERVIALTHADRNPEAR